MIKGRWGNPPALLLFSVSLKLDAHRLAEHVGVRPGEVPRCCSRHQSPRGRCSSRCRRRCPASTPRSRSRTPRSRRGACSAPTHPTSRCVSVGASPTSSREPHRRLQRGARRRERTKLIARRGHATVRRISRALRRIEARVRVVRRGERGPVGADSSSVPNVGAVHA